MSQRIYKSTLLFVIKTFNVYGITDKCTYGIAEV